jgi:hypothetical protein
MIAIVVIEENKEVKDERNEKFTCVLLTIT